VTCCRFPGTDGFLNINKPGGKTSFSIVKLVRKLTREKKVGHAGTLDPLATGVLPICIGQATRLIEYLADATKTYRAEIELGVTTDTFDADGKILQKVDAAGITREQLESALHGFIGELTQETPAYSAVKYYGKPAYELTRKGIRVIPKKRLVRVERIEILDWRSPMIAVEIDCGKGTYIRSIANDLGQMLGCGAYLKNLVRIKYGIFNIADSLTIEQIEEAVRVGYWEQLLYPMDSPLTAFPAVVVGDDMERVICNGNAISLRGCSPDSLCRVYNRCGNMLSVTKFDPLRGLWQPKKVFGKIDTTKLV
jgi:tRNA pseudouridine55 synthase